MDRDSLVYKAKLAEQAERFDEMVTDMKEVARQPQELTVEERNLLSVAYKNVIGSRRASWRVVTSIEQKGDPEKMTIIKDYKAKIEAELVEICNDILSIIEESLIPNSTSEEAKVFYYKMKGDYHRYLSEFQVGDTRKESAGAALDAYQAASGIASSDLPPTHPIRLGLALNFSVFYYGTLPDLVTTKKYRALPHSQTSLPLQRSSTRRTRPARLPSKPSMMPLLSLTPSTRSLTRTLLSSCSFCETT